MTSFKQCNLCVQVYTVEVDTTEVTECIYFKACNMYPSHP